MATSTHESPKALPEKMNEPTNSGSPRARPKSSPAWEKSGPATEPIVAKKGQTLEQVKAARPTRDYDTRYGALTGAWTTDMFVEAVYTSLKAASAKR